MKRPGLRRLSGRKAPRGVLHDRVSRRLFLGGSGALLALPFLESILPRLGSAQSASDPKRLVVVKSFSTQLIKRWYPSIEGSGYQLHDDVYGGSKADGTTLLTSSLGGGPYTQAPLSDMNRGAGISPILGPALNPFTDKLTLIRGLDYLPTMNHNFGGILGNYSSCTNATPCDADSLDDIPTIDQVLAYSSKFYPSTPALRALHISQGVEDSMSFSDHGQPGGRVEQLKARTNPLDAWNDAFASLTGTPRGGGMPAPAQGSGSTTDKLLVDTVIDQYRELRGNPRLSGADKQKLEQHVTLLMEIQGRLSASTSPGAVVSCVKPMEPEAMRNNTGTDPSDIRDKWDAFLDLAVLALSCDRTRIVTLAVHKALGPGPDPDNSSLNGHYHSEDASGGTWHGLAHDWDNSNSRRMLEGINRWIAEEFFAKLLTKMQAVEESGGSTLLDNSLVYWGNELGFNHIAYSVPCLLAGSAGGYLKTGRYLDYIDWDGQAYFSQEDGNVIKGIPHNRLLVTILQAMGLTPGDYERDGKPGYGSTSTQGRDSDAWAVNYDLSKVGEILPGIRG